MKSAVKAALLMALSLATFPANAKVDLSGLWLTPFGYGIPNADGTPFSGRPESPVTMPPMLPWVKEIHDRNVKMSAEGETDHLKFAGTGHRCLPFGTASDLMQPYPFQIVQRDDAVIFVFEANHQFRLIPITDETPKNLKPTYRGTSRGRWEGDVLVVETTGFNDKTLIISANSHETDKLSWFSHSDQLQVTEWFSLAPDGKTLFYKARIDDPGAFTAPWEFSDKFPLRNDLRLNEFVCAENNLDVANSPSPE